MDNKDLELQIKKMDREMVELLVAKELIGLTKEVSVMAIGSVGTGNYIVPDHDKWARKIIAIVKEHSV